MHNDTRFGTYKNIRTQEYVFANPPPSPPPHLYSVGTHSPRESAYIACDF